MEIKHKNAIAWARYHFEHLADDFIADICSSKFDEWDESKPSDAETRIRQYLDDNAEWYESKDGIVVKYF